MKLLRIDSVGGASGDMSLALLADLGADLESVADQIRQADAGPFKIIAKKSESKGISGTTVTVEAEEQHHHRHLPDILQIIENSGLEYPARLLAVDTFKRLADAEGKVHGISADKVHFHEVGAMDSIVDILGACAALHMLAVDAVQVGTLPVGTGTVKCAHGVMPVPVPAAAELLSGHPILPSDEPNEMVTPTGAALLMQWKQSFKPSHKASCELMRVGYGIGQKDMGRPNIIRGMILTDSELDLLCDECIELQTNLDDTTPEQVAWLQRRLLDQGALDVISEPVSMKKDRTGILLTVLAKPIDVSALKEIIFRESTTLGVRESFKTRTILKRKTVKVETEYGTVRVKTGLLGNEAVTHAPEYEDCAKLAGDQGVPFKMIYESALLGVDRRQ